MADNSTKPQQEQKAAAVEITQRGAAALAETVHASGDTLRRSAATMAQAAEQEGQATAETMRRSSEAGGEAVRRSGEALSYTVRQGAHAAVEGQVRLIEDLADQAEETGRRLARTIQGSAQTMRTLLALPSVTGRGLPELQQTMARLASSFMQTSLRATQEAVRLANPGTVFELQQRFARDCLDTLMRSSTDLLHTTRRMADETLRPLEEQLQQRQQQRGQTEGRIIDVMSRDVRVASPDDTVQQAARVMREEDTGLLPVGEHDRLVGAVTDRDLALRLVAEGRDPAKTRVREVMTPKVHYVFEDEALQRAADTMAEQQVRRLPVLNRDKRLVGVVSLGDLATVGRSSRLAGRALSGVAREGGLHNQAAAE